MTYNKDKLREARRNGSPSAQRSIRLSKVDDKDGSSRVEAE